MNRPAIAEAPADQALTHQLSGCLVEPGKLLIIERGRRGPGIKPVDPERLTLIDVADSCADPLVEQQLAQRLIAR
jgi:hypothetical protein